MHSSPVNTKTQLETLDLAQIEGDVSDIMLLARVTRRSLHDKDDEHEPALTVIEDKLQEALDNLDTFGSRLHTEDNSSQRSSHRKRAGQARKSSL